MTDKRLVVKVDSTLKGRNAAFACYIKPYFSGARGKSFPGAYYSGSMPAMDSIHCEMLGIVLAIEHANTFADITRINKADTTLQVRNDCLIAINSLELSRERPANSRIGRRLLAAMNKWPGPIELTKVSRSDLKTVHLLCNRTNNQMIETRREWECDG